MTIQKDGNHVILSGKADKVIFAELGNKEACKNYANCISGTFQYQNQANAILVYGGNVISNLSAHGWLGLPDTCLISYKDGAFAVKRLVSISKKELPKIQWTISGMGLLDRSKCLYEETGYGFCDYAGWWTYCSSELQSGAEECKSEAA